MLAPVGIVNNKVEDRESWKQAKRRPHKPKKKQREPAIPSASTKGDHIDLTA